jgi:hypothetical protein
MAARSDQAARQQQHHQQQQHDLQQSSALLESPGLKAALLGHHSVCHDQNVLLALLQSCKQLQAEAAAQCAGQLAVNAVLRERPAVAAQGFAAWLQHHAGLLRELHVDFRCLGSDGSAVLQCLQEQEQQLQALQCLALHNSHSSFWNGLQDGWAKPLLLHLPVGLSRLQLTGCWLAMHEGALAAFSRLQQLTQLTVGFRCVSALQHLPRLRSLDITDCWSWCTSGQDALAPLSQLQQLTELRLGEVQPEQLGQLPPALLQLDLTLVGRLSQHYRPAAAWFKQHGRLVRRLILNGGCSLENARDWNWEFREGEDHGDTLAAVAAVAEAFTSVAAAAAVPSAPRTANAAAVQAPPGRHPLSAAATSSSSSSSSSSSRYPLQSLRVVNMPWLLDSTAVRSLPASSLTELECSMDFFCSEEVVAAVSSLTALQALRIAYAGRPSLDRDATVEEQPDSVLAPLSSLEQLTWEFLQPAWEAAPDDADVARFTWLPLHQLEFLESLHLTFYDLRPDLCRSGLLHELQARGDKSSIWRVAGSSAEQGVGGDANFAGPAAAAVVWGCMPLKSVQLAFSEELQRETVRMPKSAVLALGALLLTVLAINGGDWLITHLGLDVTPAQLGGVLQCLPLLQHLQLRTFAMLCDERAATATEAQQQQQQQQLDAEQQQENQQQGMQPFYSAAGVIALLSAVAGLPDLRGLQLLLPLKLQPAAAQQVQAALGQLLPTARTWQSAGSFGPRMMWLETYP